MNVNVQPIIAQFVLTSTPFMLLEVRGAEPVKIKYTDQKSGKAAEMFLMQYACEALSDSAKQVKMALNITEQEFNEKVKPKFRKGQVIVVPVGSLATVKGITSVSPVRDATIELFEDFHEIDAAGIPLK